MAQSIKKISAILFALRVIRMGVSMLSVIITAKFFGVSSEKDVWVMVSAFTATIVSSVWGPLNEIFRTKFVFIRESNSVEFAKDKTASLIGFVFWATIAMGVSILLFRNNIASFMLSKLSASDQSLFLVLLFITIPTILINEITNIGISVLNSFEVYYIPEVVSAITGVLNIILMLLLAPSIGIYSLVISTYVSSLLLLVTVIYFLHKKCIHIWHRLIKFRLKDAWLFILFSLPFFFPYFISQLSVLSEKYIAGLLGAGNISIIDYSRQFLSIFQTVFGSVLTTVMVPMLAKAFANADFNEYSRILRENIQTCFLILGIGLSILIGAAEPLCNLFFGSGKVPVESLATIISLSRCYGFALIGVLIYMIFSFTLLTTNKRKEYAILGVFVQILILVLYYSLFFVTGSLYIFPFAFGISHGVTGFIMLFILKPEIKHGAPIFIVRVLMVVLIIVLLSWLYNCLFSECNTLLRLFLNVPCLVFSIPILMVGVGYSLKQTQTIIFSKITQVSNLCKNRQTT